MSTTTASAPAATTSEVATDRGPRRVLVFLWKYFLGALFCTNVVSSVLVVGWSEWAMARAVLRHWWARSPARRKGLSFEAFVADDETLERYRRWPNWILAERETRWRGEGVASLPRALAGSLYANARLGLHTLFNTWLLTLPGCGLWLFAWFAGWNNSFHKGYELAFVGPAAGFAGIALFIAAMLYVPYAQVRHAVSGEARRFFELRLVRRLRRAHPGGALMLAGLYALFAVPVNVLFVVPAFLPQISPALGELDAGAARAFLERYYFWTAVVGFGAYVVVRLAAARVYASTVLDAVAGGALAPDELAPREQKALSRLGLDEEVEPPRRHLLTKAAQWMGARAARTVAFAITLALWFFFVAQIFVREFLNYHPVIGWLNQVLVQLPYVSLIP